MRKPSVPAPVTDCLRLGMTYEHGRGPSGNRTGCASREARGGLLLRSFEPGFTRTSLPPFPIEARQLCVQTRSWLGSTEVSAMDVLCDVTHSSSPNASSCTIWTGCRYHFAEYGLTVDLACFAKTSDIPVHSTSMLKNPQRISDNP